MAKARSRSKTKSDTKGAVAKRSRGASTYATGGGGVSLERTFAALALAALLGERGLIGLGEGLKVVKVDFQAGPLSPVDDIVVLGEGAAPDLTRTMSVGVRRLPALRATDAKFVKLLADYLEVVWSQQADLDADRHRLALVVVPRTPGVSDLRVLADIARTQPSNEAFRAFVARPKNLKEAVRTRLSYLDEAVALATAQRAASQGASGPCDTWRLLKALRVLALDLEGNDATERIAVIGRLGELLGSEPAGATAFDQLVKLAADFAPVGASVDVGMLRRHLGGRVSLPTAPSAATGALRLEGLEAMLRERTGRELRHDASGGRLGLPRAEALADVAAQMLGAANTASRMTLSGEPDTGKSALALAAVDESRRVGVHVVALSLRDLPFSAVALERELGDRLDSLLGRMVSAPGRVIVLDGAEAVQEGAAEIFAYVARCAAEAGFGLVAVTRDDAKSAVAAAMGTGNRPVDHVVPGLNRDELAQVLGAFPLSRAEGRLPSTLLSRPGLIAVLLSSGTIDALPDGALSEADIYSAVWSSQVRLGERVVPGRPTPDGREDALVGLARTRFEPSRAARVPVDVLALPSLRSDGILLPVAGRAVLRRGDEFSHDIYRDFAAARVLAIDGLEAVFRRAHDPRWAIRATRLAIQATLIAATTGEVETTRAAAESTMAMLFPGPAGERWRDVPWEAALALGSAATVLGGAVDALAAEGGRELRRLLRIAQQRFLHGSERQLGQIEVLVAFLCANHGVLSRVDDEVRKDADRLVERWLEAMALRAAADVPNQTRRLVRDRLNALSARRTARDAVRSLGLLGPDMDEQSASCLLALVPDRVTELNACLEDPVCCLSMSLYHPDLLFGLSEGYFVDRGVQRGMLQGHPQDHLSNQAIRPHSARLSSQGGLAAWTHGPFWWLLRCDLQRGVGLINRLLNVDFACGAA